MRKIKTFDPGNIATALGVDLIAVPAIFKDGRVSAKFSEWWAAREFGFALATSSNQAGHDGFFKIPAGISARVSVKTLTDSGVKFQHSRYCGSGRQCSTDDLLSSIADAEYYCIVDITDFPDVSMTLVPSAKIAREVAAGRISPKGLTKAEFWSMLANEQPVLSFD